MRPTQRSPAPVRPASRREPIAVIELKHGGRDGDEPINSIPIYRRINLGDLEAADDAKGNIGRVVVLVSRLSGLTPKEIRELDAEDLGAVAAAIESLLGGSSGDGVDDGETFPG